jgi:hypothetical protein
VRKVYERNSKINTQKKVKINPEDLREKYTKQKNKKQNKNKNKNKNKNEYPKAQD